MWILVPDIGIDLDFSIFAPVQVNILHLRASFCDLFNKVIRIWNVLSLLKYRILLGTKNEVYRIQVYILNVLVECID